MRTTRGRAAAKLDSHGKCMYSVHMHVQVMIIIISGSKKGQKLVVPESTIHGCASKRGTTD